MRSPENIIVRPLLTEKGTFLKDTGGRAEADIGDYSGTGSVTNALLLTKKETSS